MALETSLPVLTSKDFASDQEIRWCPRCGDYSILAQMKKVLPTLGIPREKIVFISGIGCSSRFPYYMNTYGMHGIHGRAPGIATGLKIARPDLQVWVITGDGDSLSIGGNHLMHAIRRNVDLKIVMFNNQIYGLTKGQYSPTSPAGKKTKSSPYGSVDHPLNPLSIALGSEATFVARSVDVDMNHLTMVLDRAAHHHGTAFVEVYQDCNVFNTGAFEFASKKGMKEENCIYLEHGKPLTFGLNRDKGIRINGAGNPEVVRLSEVSEDDLLFHDEQAPELSHAFRLAQMRWPNSPEPMGVFRAVQHATYDEEVDRQLRRCRNDQGPPDLETLFNSGETWEVGESATPQHEGFRSA
jgi:2-oxoglutarate ferredoxin oxidoreductase subunit beta